MIVRNNGRPFIKVLLLMLRLMGFHLRSSMVRVIVVYVKYMSSLANRQGIKGLVLNLKNCHMALMQSIAGYHVDLPSGPRVSRTRLGLPRVIPIVHRGRIKSNDELIIRL